MHNPFTSIRPAAFPRWRPFLLTLFVSLASFIAPLAASPSSFSGTYQLDPEASDDIQTVLDPALSELNLFKRAIGQKVVDRRLLPDLQQIDVEAGEFSVKLFDGRRPPLEIPSTGKEIDHQTERGNWMKVRGELTDDVFRARITGENSVTYLHSRLCPRGEELNVQVKFEYRDFSEPVYFHLVYRKKGTVQEESITQR